MKLITDANKHDRNEEKCNDTWNDTEWTRYWGVDADEYECDDYANEAED